jgi:diadenosine tetraphosphate (Ap4A) HIT family hydrolase
MAIVEQEEWPKLDIAMLNDWRLSVAANQHVLGWLIIFPPLEEETSIVHLSDQQMVEFKRIGLVAEELLKNTFQSEWFNYLQEGNGVRRLHIHLEPRYSSNREFEGHTFTDEGWGRKVKFLKEDQLAPKDLLFKIVVTLRENLAKMEIEDFKVEISNT